MDYHYPESKQYLKPANELPPVDRQYSITHVQKRFKELYDLDVRKIDYGYKGYRYRKFIEYNVFDENGECIMHHVTLKALAEHLVKNNEY